MLDFSRKDALNVQEKTFHSYGVFKTGMVHCYKHSTPNGVQSQFSREKKLRDPIGEFTYRSNSRQLRIRSNSLQN